MHCSSIDIYGFPLHSCTAFKEGKILHVHFGIFKTEHFDYSNEGILAASFYHQVAARFPENCNFYFVKNHKIAKKTQQLIELEKK
jgi:hypothetical protein